MKINEGVAKYSGGSKKSKRQTYRHRIIVWRQAAAGWDKMTAWRGVAWRGGKTSAVTASLDVVGWRGRQIVIFSGGIALMAA